ncbi:MAG: hypothetical protein ACK4ND_12695 [Cytophagaceae bacterium]
MNNIFLVSLVFLSSFLLKDCSNNFVEVALDDSDQLAVVEDPEVGYPILKYNNGVLEDFSQEIWSWWVANDKLSLQKIAGDTLKVTIKGAGRNYDCWGREFPRMFDFTEAPVAKISMRYEGQLAPTVRVSFKDVDGNDANYAPPSIRLRKGEAYDYYFNFEGKWQQGWPDIRDVDPTKIREVLFFVNPGTMDWHGTLYIDGIQMVRVEDIVSIKDQRAAAAEPEAPAPSPKKEVEPSPAPEGAAPSAPREGDMATDINRENINVGGEAESVTIDNFKNGIDSWWFGDRLAISKDGETLKVESKGAGPAFETFGRQFDRIDFTKTPVVKIRLKAPDGKPGELRVDIKDMEGFSTNAKPVVIKFKSGTEFVDYYYNFTGRFEQSYPNVGRVNPSQIIEMLFFINPGGKEYTGSFFIDEIKAISLEEFNRVK